MIVWMWFLEVKVGDSECIPKIKPLRFGDRLNISFERNEVTNDWLIATRIMK